MRITVDGVTYEHDGRLMASEGKALKTYTGMSLKQFGEASKDGDIDALIFLVWMLKRRAGEKVKYSEVDFDLTALDIEDDEPEDEAARPTGESPSTQ